MGGGGGKYLGIPEMGMVKVRAHPPKKKAKCGAAAGVAPGDRTGLRQRGIG